LAVSGTALIGAGVHPDGAFGDVVHVDEPRYHEIHAQLRGLLRRTPTSALHVHVGVPDRETGIHVYNHLREWLPLLQALAGNSPFWHGTDSGLATARAQLFRGYPRSDIPPAFASFSEFEETVAAVTTAGDAPDYTFLWWDIRPHPNLGTVEVRAMDAQSSLRAVHGLVALVVGLARAAMDERVRTRRRWSSREALEESSFRAARDGIAATLLHDGALRPVPELVVAALDRIGNDPALDEVVRILNEGAGADRQRAAHARGGMPAVLELLAAETADLKAYR
jgi:glutamate---cysteine ligase / carboxylate-amine ligase